MSGAAVVVVVGWCAPACAGDAPVGTGGGGGGGGCFRGTPETWGYQIGGSGFGTGVGCGVPACAGDARVGGGEGDGDLRAPVGVVGTASLRLQGLSTDAGGGRAPVGEAAAGTATAGAAEAAALAAAERAAAAISRKPSMASKLRGTETAQAQGDNDFVLG